MSHAMQIDGCRERTGVSPILPRTGWVRLWQIIGDAERGTPPVIPVSKTVWWDGIKAGRFPKGVKLGPNTTAWRAEEIHALIESLSEKAA